MERANLAQVTANLLAARHNLQLQREGLRQLEKMYAEAESAFLNGAGAVEPLAQDGEATRQPEWPDKVISGNTVIIAKEDWYDLKPGERLEYHTVQAV